MENDTETNKQAAAILRLLTQELERQQAARASAQQRSAESIAAQMTQPGGFAKRLTEWRNARADRDESDGTERVGGTLRPRRSRKR
jgi:hypothetical protein